MGIAPLCLVGENAELRASVSWWAFLCAWFLLAPVLAPAFWSVIVSDLGDVGRV